MSTTYARLANLDDIARYVLRVSARTLIIDVEPFVAHWESNQEALDHGIARLLDHVATIPGLLVVCFSTNSSRRPAALPSGLGVQVEYLASAGKPLQTAPYRQFPRPAIVIGDQVLTDGLLARRLGYTFLHYCPDRATMPPGPRLLNRLGALARPVLWRGTPGCRD